MRTIDQRCGQIELGAQARFETRHASIVRFMIVAGKVQHAVQHQDFQFSGKVMTVALSVFAGDLSRDGDVAAGWSREREHVGRLVFAAKAAVELTQALVACDQDIYFTFYAGQRLGASGKALELRSS